MARSDGWTTRMAATQRHLVDVALGLFERDGYDRVTVSSIARAAGVGERTVYRYFPTKEAFVLGQQARNFDAFVAALHHVPPELSITEAIGWVGATFTPSDTPADAPADRRPDDERRRLALLRATPSLQHAWTAELGLLEPKMRGWIATRSGRDADAIELRVAAGALVAAYRALVETWDGTDLAAYRDRADRALRLLHDGLGTLGP